MRTRIGVVGSLTAIGAALALALPAGAGALPAWSPVGAMESGGASAAVAEGASGDVAVAWAGFAAGRVVAQIATRAPSGSFSAPLVLSPPGSEARAPVVAVDGAGEAVAAWPAAVSNYIVEAATVKGGVVSTPQKLSAPGQNALFPAVAADERGDAIVAWVRSNGTENIAQASFRPAGGAFGAPVNVSATGGSAMNPQVAIDAAGDATVVWERFSGGEDVVEAAARPAGTGAFGVPTPLGSSIGNPMEPAVAMNAEGDTAVAWVSPEVGKVIHAAVKPAGKAFSTPANLTLEMPALNQPHVALDGRGNPTVVWIDNFVVEYDNGTAAGTFSGPRGLAFEGWYPSIAEDAAGDTVVGYANPLAYSAGAVFRPAGGPFGAPQTVSEAGDVIGGGPSALGVAMSEGGDGALAFVGEPNGGEATAQLSLLDTTGVALGGVSIPANATAGAPAAFSAEPLDQVFPHAAVTWAFGDASTAAGATVTHTFATPGTYSVTVTATAAPGDSTTRTGTIVVAPAAPPAAAPAFAAATLGSAAVTADRHGRVPLRVACPSGGAACAGTVQLTLPASASGLAVAARASGTPVTVAAGQAPFSAAPGATASVAVTLPAPVVKLLARHRRLTLTATVETHGGAGQLASREAQVVVRAPARPGKPRRTHRRR